MGVPAPELSAYAALSAARPPNSGCQRQRSLPGPPSGRSLRGPGPLPRAHCPPPLGQVPMGPRSPPNRFPRGPPSPPRAGLHGAQVPPIGPAVPHLWQVPTEPRSPSPRQVPMGPTVSFSGRSPQGPGTPLGPTVPLLGRSPRSPPSPPQASPHGAQVPPSAHHPPQTPSGRSLTGLFHFLFPAALPEGKCPKVKSPILQTRRLRPA